MLKWLPTAAAAILAAFAAVSDTLTPIIAAHPKLALYVGLITAILANFAPQPHKPE